MSGYAGIVHLGGTETHATDDAERIQKMLAAVTFRGPDDQMVWTQPSLQFCFSFMKTGPAPQVEKQPYSLDGIVWLLGDVRLDGRQDVLRAMDQRGVKLEKTATDEETVCHAFRTSGATGVANLDGDFSIVLWDTEERKLLGFRDLTGSKPFFYCAAKDSLSFSNTIDALHTAPGFTGTLDENFIGDYLLAGWCPDLDRTVYKEIRRLPPGHVLEYSSRGLKICRAARLPIEEMLGYKREDEYIEHYCGLLDSAVKDRLPRGTSVVFMSGGLDSTAVAAVANRISSAVGAEQRVRAQTLDYRSLFEDREGEEARAVAEFLKIPFELLHGGECEPFAGWDKWPFRMPEPRHEPYLALHVENYRRAAVDARVALSGDGGDDVLLGQAWPYLRHLIRNGKLMSAAGGVARHLWNTKRLPVLGLGIRSRIQNRFGGDKETESFPEWIGKDFETRLHLRERFAELQRTPASDHPTHPRAYTMLDGPFWPNVLEGEDAAWSGVAVESRAPLLDRRIVRYLLRLPVLPWCMDKHLARRAMKDVLPKRTVERGKTHMAEDPLQLQVTLGRWNPLPEGSFSEFLQERVDIGRLENCLGSKGGESLYTNLRPVSLDRWLKSVEMSRGIQYSR